MRQQRLAALAAGECRVRRSRRQILPEALCDGPGWIMLLELYQRHVTGGALGESGLCLASGAPISAAIRWLALLESSGLVVRRMGQQAQRRSEIRLSKTGFDAMVLALNDLGNVRDGRLDLQEVGRSASLAARLLPADKPQ